MNVKEFTMKHEFRQAGKLEDGKCLYSPVEEYFGVKWKIGMERKNEYLGLFLFANMAEKQESHADFSIKIFSKKKETTYTKFVSKVFKNKDTVWCNWGIPNVIDWETMENEYLDNDGKLEVEVNVTIYKLIGFPREKELRSFGEEMERFSDIILRINKRKFHVLKLYLSTDSLYFADLFLDNSEESENPEIELKDVDPDDFQYYLEVLYGENPIDDDTVEGILAVADKFKTPRIVKKCEEFLVKQSEMELKEKLELAGKHRLEKLKKFCLNRIKSRADIRSVIPANLREMDHEIMTELFRKALDFD